MKQYYRLMAAEGTLSDAELAGATVPGVGTGIR